MTEDGGATRQRRGNTKDDSENNRRQAVRMQIEPGARESLTRRCEYRDDTIRYWSACWDVVRLERATGAKGRND